MKLMHYYYFFPTELLDGRKGLIPMNFCERLTGDDLLEFHQSVVLGFTSEEEVSANLKKKSQNQFGLNPLVGRMWRNNRKCYPNPTFPISMT